MVTAWAPRGDGERKQAEFGERTCKVTIAKENYLGGISPKKSTMCPHRSDLDQFCTYMTSLCITSPHFSTSCMNLHTPDKYVYDRCYYLEKKGCNS
jgi:hypothetical protein